MATLVGKLIEGVKTGRKAAVLSLSGALHPVRTLPNSEWISCGAIQSGS
ncbi:MAG: hypothetical protein ACRERU_02425 [Methylococcales bacterium]